MKRCDYYNCTEYVIEDVQEGLMLCDDHMSVLVNYIEEKELFHAALYCLSSMGSKAYDSIHTVL